MKKRTTRYYNGDKCLWVAESPEIPDKLDFLKTIMFLHENNIGAVTKITIELEDAKS